LISTGEKEMTMIWRARTPAALEASDGNQDHDPPSMIRRAFQRKERRRQQRAVAENEVEPTGEVPALGPQPPIVPTPEDVQQLLHRANSLLSSAPGAPGDDLRQRLAELGPNPQVSQVLQVLGSIPEVLQVFQDLLRNENAAEPDLPQYSEGDRRR
jgi:hypothetical protein